jgi:hypothetical protein
MAEELRFFLRTAVYSVVIATVYWFASYAETGAYEWAGTVLLAFVVFSAGAFVFVTGIHVPAAWRSTVRDGVAGTLNRAFGMAEDPEVVASHPLDGGPDLLPTASPWPIIGGTAALFIGLGLVYGPWLLLPGIAVAIGTAIGWIAQETRRA